MTNTEAGQFRVLLVDDFDVVKLMMKNALKNLGITDTSEASEGKEALSIINEANRGKNPFKLVLCDWNMPGMNGLQFIRELRSMPHLKTLKVVLVTATSSEKELSEAAQYDVTDYIVKPISPDGLQSKLQTIISRIRSGL